MQIAHSTLSRIPAVHAAIYNKDESSRILTGVLVNHTPGESVVIAGTCGRVLVEETIADILNTVGGDAVSSIIIAAVSIPLLSRYLKSTKHKTQDREHVLTVTSATSATLTSPCGQVLPLVLIEGSYPNYRMAFPYAGQPPILDPRSCFGVNPVFIGRLAKLWDTEAIRCDFGRGILCAPIENPNGRRAIVMPVTLP